MKQSLKKNETNLKNKVSSDSETNTNKTHIPDNNQDK